MMRASGFKDQTDTSCTILPFSHLYGLQVGILLTCMDGGSAVLQDPAQVQGIDRILDVLCEHNVTIIQSVPLFAYLIAKAPGAGEKLRSLRRFVSGGCKLSEQVFDRFKEKVGIEIQEGYGLTEAGPVCSAHHPGVPIRISTVGRPFPGCTFQTIGPDGAVLPAGAEGQLCVRSGSLMECYYEDEQTTAQTLRDGWLSTGDRGFVDADGYVHLTGLIKDMIDVGGRNVYPQEVKRFLLMHPNVDDVSFTHTTNPLLGAKLEARIKLKVHSAEQESAVTKWAIQNIESYKLPKRWQFA
jgi:acyl-CoA synthetase (AMP-forming)/AMP-acid ligase II